MIKEKRLKNPNSNPHKKEILKSVRYNVEEFRVIIEKAHLYADGNICKLIRMASLAYRPTKKELK